MLTDICAERRGAYKISVSEAPFKVLHSRVVLTHKDSTRLPGQMLKFISTLGRKHFYNILPTVQYFKKNHSILRKSYNIINHPNNKCLV
jgi:hypothetical protein